MEGQGGSGSYATGGMIGYDPNKALTPPPLSNIAQMFPQIGYATGGGTTLIPSAQRLYDLLPSERSLYSGYLQDEAGAQPQDIFEMTRRLSPQIGNLRTPRFAA